MGLDVYLYRGEDPVNHPSGVYPDHLFRIGYFRSSYNDDGFEWVLGDAIGRGLHHVFAVETESYEVRPDWQASLARAVAVRDAFDAHLRDVGSYRVLRLSGPVREDCIARTSVQALQVFREQRQASRFDTYSSAWGSFWRTPFPIRALIHGRHGSTFVVCEDDGTEWYQHAIRIVIETIEFVLGQPEPNEYLLHWNG